MKAVVLYEAGGPEQFVYTDVPTPEVKEGWSLVKVKGFGINHSEIFTRRGASPNVEFPRILGVEGVGVIEESSDSDRLPQGQKVMSLMGEMGREFDGSYAEYMLLPNEQIYPVNTDLPWEVLATIPETYFTAYGSLKQLQIEETDRVLVRGGTSSVGLAFLHLLKGKFEGIFVDGTTRDLDKKRQLLGAGFDNVVEDRNNELQTVKTYDKIFELVGPATLRNSFQHINDWGIISSTGQLGNKWTIDEFDPIGDIKENSYLTGFPSASVNENKVNELLSYIEDNDIEVKPQKVFTLENTQKAHEYVESDQSFGKVVVLTNGDGE